ncbi:MAG: hypothetical protein V4615_07550 [Bacteroidota bacterium]
MKTRPVKKISFEFVFDYLLPLEPVVKPMFGCHALYVGEKIVLILRERNDHPEANGVWLATSSEHHQSLKSELPSLCSIYILSDGKAETNWQMLPSAADDFEISVIRVCEMVKHSDNRIGKVPKGKKKSKPKN